MANVPDTYQEVQWIKSTGTQYIDTLVNLRHQVKISMTVMFTETISSPQLIYGAYYDIGAYPKVQLFLDTGGIFDMTPRYGGEIVTTDYPLLSRMVLNTDYEFDATNITRQDSDVTARIFARSNDKGDILCINGMCLKHAEMYDVDDDVAIRNYIPVRNKTTNVCGLYDTINDVFYGDAAGGAFVCGPDVPEPQPVSTTYYVVPETDLQTVAQHIRDKAEIVGGLTFPQGFCDAIDAISTGGGGPTNYVTFTAQEANSSVKIEIVGTLSLITLFYSTDNTTWQPYTVNTVITLTNIGDFVSFYGAGNWRATYSSSNYLHFVMTGKIAGSGDCNALLDAYTDATMPYCCTNMFKGCAVLTQAPELPATTLATYCYYGMFYGCTSLTQAPELPATTLINSCYENMFRGCTSLVQAPDLPATTLEYYCYDSMFFNCSSLAQAPELPAITLVSYCYEYMFYGCASLVQAPELPATTLATSCYAYMFYGCTSLTQAPELSATTLVTDCYQEMFRGCTSLTQAPALPATKLATECYQYMFYGCTSLTQAPNLPATTLVGQCYDSMFYGCTSLTQAPELPATTLANYCYSNMFRSCTALAQAPALPATTLKTYCYEYMFYGCTSLVQAPELPATTLTNYCYDYMFYGCTSLTQAPELPATMLRTSCYQYMFSGCTSLTSVKTAVSTWNTSYATNWLSTVASVGTVYCPSGSTIPSGSNSGIPSGWARVDWTPSA